MGQPTMLGTGKHAVGQTKLPDATEPLHLLGTERGVFVLGQAYVAVNRIALDMRKNKDALSPLENSTRGCRVRKYSLCLLQRLFGGRPGLVIEPQQRRDQIRNWLCYI